MSSVSNSNHVLSDEAFKQGIKSIAEGKSLSQSGCHYSMYEAMLAFPFTIQIMVKLLNTGVQSNVILQRWDKVLQVMLCKLPGNFELEKMRVK